MTYAHLDFVGDIARVTLDHPTGNRINFAIMTLQGGVMQLAERIGRTEAIEVVMLSEPLPAEQLAAWNIVNRVVDDHALAASAETFAERLTANLARTNAASAIVTMAEQRLPARQGRTLRHLDAAVRRARRAGAARGGR
jgi:enoyl-CoA hydratase/carnithine racemase